MRLHFSFASLFDTARTEYYSKPFLKTILANKLRTYGIEKHSYFEQGGSMDPMDPPLDPPLMSGVSRVTVVSVVSAVFVVSVVTVVYSCVCGDCSVKLCLW